VVRGKVSFPDLRIEYATQEKEIARLDLELATRRLTDISLTSFLCSLFLNLPHHL